MPCPATAGQQVGVSSHARDFPLYGIQQGKTMTDENKSSTTRCRPPRLLIWSHDAIFLGTCLSRQAPYRTTQELMVVCLQGELALKTGDGNEILTRSCLIPAGVFVGRELIESRQAILGICFLAPFSQDYPALASQMEPVDHGMFCHHADETAVIRAMITARDRPDIDIAEARTLIRDALIPKPLQHLMFRDYDPRAVTVARRIRDHLHDSPSLASLANEVNLSQSRLEKLFKEQAGLPITQYRVRYRVFISTLIMALGYSITEAALLAGFSNSAHLSRCYRQVNGVTPSSTFLNPPHLEAVIAPSAMALVEPLLEGQPTA